MNIKKTVADRRIIIQQLMSIIIFFLINEKLYTIYFIKIVINFISLI